jgi:hypothetical protein
MTREPMGSDVLDEMAVTNATVALELLAKDAHPMQQYRELTENASAAILHRPEKAGTILWDVEWDKVERDGVYRLACIDNGEGMTAEDLVRYINTLFLSGREQGPHGNFGIGAKVTAGARNPEGVLYLSWRGGQGGMVQFKRAGGPMSPYGLVRWEAPGGRRPSFQPAPERMKPDLIKDHGTMVVLMGGSPDDATVLPPGAPASQGLKWLSRYLNTRYFEFPAGVDVQVRELPADRARWPASKPQTEAEWRASGVRVRTITGMRRYLDTHAEASGVFPLSSAQAWWWVLPADLSGGDHDVHIPRGHTAALYQRELYDLVDGNSHRYRMQAFGVLYAGKRIVIYVEPTGPVAANVSRSALSIEGEPLPWEEWGAEFRAAMPEAIREVERRVREEASAEDFSKTIRQRLQPYRELFQVTSWRRQQEALERASGQAPSGRGEARDDGEGAGQPVEAAHREPCRTARARGGASTTACRTRKGSAPNGSIRPGRSRRCDGSPSRRSTGRPTARPTTCARRTSSS